MQFIILLLCSCHLLSGQALAGATVSVGGYHDVNSVEIQAINSYLTSKLKKYRGEPSVVTGQIDQAIKLIESEPDINKFPAELRQNSHEILPILKDISRSAKSCQDIEDLGFLSIIADSQTFKGQILNQYAIGIIMKCWASYVDFFAKKLDVSLGKIKSPLVESLSLLYYRFKDAKISDNNSEIKIREQPSENPPAKELVRIFVDFNLVDGDENTLAKAINRLARANANDQAEDPTYYTFEAGKFFTNHYLEPCKSFLGELSRFRSKFNFTKYVDTTLGRALHAKSANDKQLAYELQVCRICRYLMNNEKSIATKLR